MDGSSLKIVNEIYVQQEQLFLYISLYQLISQFCPKSNSWQSHINYIP